MRKKLFDVNMVVEIETKPSGELAVVTNIPEEGQGVLDQMVGLPATVVSRAIAAVEKHLAMLYNIAQERAFRESLGQTPARDVGQYGGRSMPSNN